jgi:Winged helix DNA-binding domain
LGRGVKVLEQSLSNLHYLTRDALGSALANAGLPLQGQSLAYLMMYAELEGIVCSGPRQGRQFTYALLEERAAPSPAIDRDEALARLALRYFASHGPATLRDFASWSGLTVREGKGAVATAGDALANEPIGGLTYWFSPGRAAKPLPSPAVLLLPNYDELGIAYRDRVLLRTVPRPKSAAGREELAHLLVIDREITGRWRRDVTPRSVVVDVQPFRSLTRAETLAVEAAVDAYGAFLGLPATTTGTRRARRAG